MEINKLDYNYIVDNISIGSIPLPGCEEELVKNFDAVLSVTNCYSFVDYTGLGLEYRYVPFADGSMPSDEQLSECITWLDKQLSCGNRVLCHCSAGISRSPFIVAYYLMLSYDWHSDAALGFVKSKRNIADPYIGYVEFLRKINHESYAANETVLADNIREGIVI